MNVTQKINEEYRDWGNGDIITIKAGTGKGKSYFIKTKLYIHAKENGKKILMLLHRKNCMDQFRHEIKEDNKSDVIDIISYQFIENKIKKREQFDFSKYDYLCLDEFHYFMSDSSYNKYTDMSLNEILKQNDKVRIFMSATGDYMKQYINRIRNLHTIDYDLEINFDFIKQLNFFNKEDTFERLVKDRIANNEKAIFFIQSAKLAYKLHKQFKEYSMFNCGKSNDHNLHKYVDQEKINFMIVNERFDDLILFTTSVMDAGVNINDDELNHIVVDMEDTGKLIQSIGRKRLKNKDDHINLYIKTMSDRKINGRLRSGKERIEKAEFLKRYGSKAYTEAYPRENDEYCIVYDVPIAGEDDKLTKNVNDLMFYKIRTDMSEYKKMKNYGKYGYCKYIAAILNLEYTIIEEEESHSNLEKYLKDVSGKKLFKDDQQKLKNVFKENGLQARTLGIYTLNGNLKDREMNYMIISKTSSHRINGKLKSYRYWEVICDIEI